MSPDFSRPIWTRVGQRVEIVSFCGGGVFTIIALVDTDSGRVVRRYSLDGIWEFEADAQERPSDLVNHRENVYYLRGANA